jgi:hypothetical protein|tara:strand:+ start:27064 stop:27267 length:204 start_codon:yes stop_codon:yes gene_type:complete
MLNFYKLENKNEKQKAYNAIRDIVLKDFPTAILQEAKEGFYILWYGVAISEVSNTAYDAWLDVALPY